MGYEKQRGPKRPPGTNRLFGRRGRQYDNRKPGREGQANRRPARPGHEGRINSAAGRPHNRGKASPPAKTNAENYYYAKQISNKVPIVVVMKDEEEIRGRLEWYDRDCLKIKCHSGKNMVLRKHFIQYIFKQEELDEESS